MKVIEMTAMYFMFQITCLNIKIMLYCIVVLNYQEK